MSITSIRRGERRERRRQDVLKNTISGVHLCLFLGRIGVDQNVRAADLQRVEHDYEADPNRVHCCRIRLRRDWT